MTKQEKAIREFCGHHADWWPSTTQVQEMLALAQPDHKPVKDWIASHNDICALLKQAHDALALTSYPPQRTKQKPVAFASHGVINWIADKQFQHEADLYTAPQIKIGCAECGVNGNHALYCVKCAEKYLKEKNT